MFYLNNPRTLINAQKFYKSFLKLVAHSQQTSAYGVGLFPSNKLSKSVDKIFSNNYQCPWVITTENKPIAINYGEKVDNRNGLSFPVIIDDHENIQIDFIDMLEASDFIATENSAVAEELMDLRDIDCYETIPTERSKSPEKVPNFTDAHMDALEIKPYDLPREVPDLTEDEQELNSLTSIPVQEDSLLTEKEITINQNLLEPVFITPKTPTENILADKEIFPDQTTFSRSFIGN